MAWHMAQLSRGSQELKAMPKSSACSQGWPKGPVTQGTGTLKAFGDCSQGREKDAQREVM